MGKITLTDEMKKGLNGFQETYELCDEKGQTRGYFLPPEEYRMFVQAWLKAQISDEELEELKKQVGGKPLKEIWKSLGRS